LPPRLPERTSRYVILLERSHDEYDNETMTDDEAIAQVRDELQQAMDDRGVPNGWFRIVDRQVAVHGDLFGPLVLPAIAVGPAKKEA
jgi:hypothetical protein